MDKVAATKLGCFSGHVILCSTYRENLDAVLFVQVPFELEASRLLLYPAKDFVLKVGCCDDSGSLQVAAEYLSVALSQKKSTGTLLSDDLIQICIRV